MATEAPVAGRADRDRSHTPPQHPMRDLAGGLSLRLTGQQGSTRRLDRVDDVPPEFAQPPALRLGEQTAQPPHRRAERNTISDQPIARHPPVDTQLAEQLLAAAVPLPLFQLKAQPV